VTGPKPPENPLELRGSIGDEIVISFSSGGGGASFSVDGRSCLGVFSSGDISVTGASLAQGDIAVFADVEANGSRLAFQGAISAPGEIADMAIGVATAETGVSAPFLPPAQPKKRLIEAILPPSTGEVVEERGAGSAEADGNVVISFRGEFFGVILKVARGLVGALIGRPRAKF